MSPFEFAAWLFVAFCLGCLAAEWWRRREDDELLRSEDR